MKKAEIIVKLQIKSGEANPSPPIGPALGSKGINIIKFCTEFNEKTKNMPNFKKGTILPTIVYIFKDKSFLFTIKSPPTSVLIKNILNIEKGSNYPNKLKIKEIKKEQLLIIIKEKGEELIVKSEKAALNTIAGTAKSMGININGL